MKEFNIILMYYDNPKILNNWIYRLLYLSDYQKYKHKSKIIIADSGTPEYKIEETYRKPVRKIADLWCSRFFGNEYSYLTYNGLVKYLQDENAALNPLDESALLASEELAKRYRFFHWRRFCFL